MDYNILNFKKLELTRWAETKLKKKKAKQKESSSSLQKNAMYTYVKVAQSCLTLCNPLNYIVHGILQARILEWVACSLFQGTFPTKMLENKFIKKWLIVNTLLSPILWLRWRLSMNAKTKPLKENYWGKDIQIWVHVAISLGKNSLFCSHGNKQLPESDWGLFKWPSFASQPVTGFCWWKSDTQKQTHIPPSTN